MPKTRAKKEELVKVYIEKLNKGKSVAIANFQRLTVKEVENLRKKCREINVECLVAKKNLLAVALKEKGLDEGAIDIFENNIGVAFGADEIAPAKLFSNFAKEHGDKFNLIAGILENKMISVEQIRALANLPSKEELLAKIVGSIQAPISNFVNVLQGNIRGLAQVLNRIKESKE
ncbi:MAG: 50S ribosomal protein L10 [bacterium]